MGMVDNILVVDEDPRFLGLSSFQSKDFHHGDWGAELYIYKGRLYQRTRSRLRIEVDESVTPPELMESYALTLCSLAGTFLIYSCNTRVPPVLTLSDIDEEGFRWDAVREHDPWVEIRLHVDAQGFLAEVEVVKNESRDEVRDRLLKNGANVLQDDDRIAISHFRAKERRRARNRDTSLW